jgi:hypothetical protein
MNNHPVLSCSDLTLNLGVDESIRCDEGVSASFGNSLSVPQALLYTHIVYNNQYNGLHFIEVVLGYCWLTTVFCLRIYRAEHTAAGYDSKWNCLN